MAIKIYTDAASNLFKQIIDDKGYAGIIKVLTMTLDVGDKTYRCYEDDIDVEKMSVDFYSQMEEGLRPKTSLVSPGTFLEKMEEEIKLGNEVIYVSLAGGISGSYQSACMISDQLNEENKKDVVKVINSKTAGFGEGMIVMHAAELVKQGKTLNEVYEDTLKYVDTVRSEFTVESIKYLAQTGRVSKVTATLASLLAIKPLLYGSPEGKIESTSKVHGRNASLKTLAKQVNEYIKDKNSLVYISHCNSLNDANKIKELLKGYGINNVEIHFFDLVSGAHVGPGSIGVFYESTTRDFKGLLTRAKEKVSGLIDKK